MPGTGQCYLHVLPPNSKKLITFFFFHGCGNQDVESLRDLSEVTQLGPELNSEVLFFFFFQSLLSCLSWKYEKSHQTREANFFFVGNFSGGGHTLEVVGQSFESMVLGPADDRSVLGCLCDFGNSLHFSKPQFSHV